jgi:guanylate kinase
LTGKKKKIKKGPSGSGKGTIKTLLKEKYPNKFEFSISCTTRYILQIKKKKTKTIIKRIR